MSTLSGKEEADADEVAAVADQLASSVSLGGSKPTEGNSNIYSPSAAAAAAAAAENSPPPAVSKEADKSCAACGTAGDGLKRCTACKSVWYCGVNCQIDHRKAHKKECKRIKKELEAREKQEGQKDGKGAADKDERFSLFNPRPRPDCPICMVVMPLNPGMQTYMQCCGKSVCSGCVYAHINTTAADGAVSTCPFCRRSASDSEEKTFEGIVSRVESGDARAVYELAVIYKNGDYGLPADHAKALELLQQAADLGCIDANRDLGNRYRDGCDGLRKSDEKAILYWEFAAKKGDPGAQHYLGWMEIKNGNIDLGIRHLRISAQRGYKRTVESLRNLAKLGYLREKDLEEVENGYDDALEAMRTDDRDKFNALHHIDWDELW